MRIKHHELEIPKDNPFLNCKLDREKYADILTSMVSTYADGFVLAINNEWGTGKSTFVKMWQQKLNSEGFKTLLFNAWENDFEDGALVAIMAELSTLKDTKTKKAFDKVLETGKVLSKGILPALLKTLSAKIIGNDLAKEMVDSIADNAESLLENQIDEYTTKKKGLVEFRKALTEYIKALESDKPIIFIVDELDRCRPNYAVEVLEKLKHFFSVPGIVFVLSIDKKELGNSVRGVYGTDKINADEYLRRFIDVEYSIPEPDTKMYCEYLYEYFDFKKFFSHPKRTHNEIANDGYQFLQFATILFQKSNLTLRQQEKLFIQSRIVLNSFNSEEYLFPSLFLFLNYTKHYFIELYDNIRLKNATVQEVISEYEKSIPIGITDEDMRIIVLIQAQLAVFYKNYINTPYPLVKIYKYENSEDNVLINSTLKFKEDDSFFKSMVKYYSTHYNLNNLSISHLLEKIDLTKGFVED